MPHLDIPGASLNYETVGSGPVLLCITGAGGSLEFFKPLAELLKDRYTVVIYDRRGFSRSHLIGAQDYAHRIETDADDVAALLKQTAPDGTGSVLGNGSGAIVALKFFERHPDAAKIVIVHEPPAHKFLPEWEHIAAGSQQIYQVYREQGMPPALELFAKAVKLNEHETKGLLWSMDPRSGQYAFQNAMYWFEREFSYPATEFDMAALEKAKEKLVLANGEETDPGAGHYRPNVLLAEKLGLKVKMLAGGHLGAVSHAEAFAKGVAAILKGR